MKRHDLDILSLFAKTPEGFKVQALAGKDLCDVHIVQRWDHTVDANRHRPVDVAGHQAQQRIAFRVPAALGALLVSKGSVAVDGISLTVNECRSGRFSVAIIPFTLQHTNLRARRVGDKVNIETDLIGKYVQSFMQQRQ